MYMVLKHSHMLFAGLVLAFFIFRWLLRLTGSGLVAQRGVKITAMVLDFSLLILGVVAYFQIPLGLPFWLVAKWVLIGVYVYFSFYCVRKAVDRTQVFATGLLALLALLGVMWLAVVRPVLW